MRTKQQRSAWITSFVFILPVMGLSACATGSGSKTFKESQIGSAHLQRGHAELAEREFRSVLAKDPNNAEAHYELGRLEAMRGNANEARHHFETVVSKQPYNASAHVNLGWSLVELGQVNEAERHFERTLELEDEEASAQAGLGAVCLARHEPDRAKAYFDKALKLNPSHAVTHYYLGEYFQYRGDLPRAVEHYKRCAAHRNQMQAKAYYKMACCYADLQKKDASFNALQQAARHGFKNYAKVVEDARFKNYKPTLDTIFSDMDRGPDR